MEIVLEKSLEKCGNNGKYQLKMLIVTIIMCMVGEVLVATFGYLEVWPIVLYTDALGYQHEETLTYEVCQNNTNYKILDSESKHTFVYDFKIYCNQLEISMLGTSYFIGVFLGSFTTPMFTIWIINYHRILFNNDFLNIIYPFK